MDCTSLISRFLFFALFFLSVFLFSCNNSQSIDRKFDNFNDLRLITIGLEFPHTQKDLSNCLDKNYQPCLKIYNRVKSAKQKLFANSSSTALQITLKAISTQCIKKSGKDKASSICQGASTSLYFFNKTDDDRKIQSLFSNASPSLIKRVIDENGSWLLNRVNKKQWKEWVDKLKNNEEFKRGFIAILNENASLDLSINKL